MPEPTPPEETAPEPLTAFQAEPGRVALYDPDGAMQSVPVENAEAAVREYGYRPASRGEVISQKEGAYGTFKAGLYGAARGATFGVFDPVAIAASRAAYGEEGADLAREELNLQKESHPTASLVGEIGGSLLPLAVGAPAAAEGAVAGESLLARAASRAAAAAPRAAGEGAALGLGQQLSEDALGNHELVAQKYIASALEGGLFGAILGAGLHAGVGAIGDKVAMKAASAATKGEGTAYRSIGSKLADFSEEQAAKGVLPSSTINASELQKLGRTAEEQQTRLRRIGRNLIEEGISTAGASKAVQAERLTTRLGEVGEELGVTRKALDKSVVRPSAETILERMESEVLTPLMSKPFSAAEQASIRPYVADIVKHLGGTISEDGAVSLKKPAMESFDQLHKLRGSLDGKLDQKLWAKVPGTAPAAFEELGKIRGILESEFEAAAERAAVDLGEDVASKYRLQKALFSDLKTAEKWATKAAAREAQNHAISLTDTIAAGAGLATGSPLGLLAPIANKLKRTYGNQAAAAISNKAAKLLGVQRAAEVFDRRLEAAAKGFFGKGKAVRVGEKKPTPKVDAETTRALRQAVQNPGALNDRVAAVVGATGLQEVAPKVTQAMTSTIMRAAAYLQQTIPPEPPPAGVSFGPSKARALGPQAQAKVTAAVGALDLNSLLDDIERGRVDRQKVEALRIINPHAHQAIVTALTRQGIENAATLTHQQEVALSILTGNPIGAMMQPRTIRGFQQAHAQGAPPDPAQAGVARQPFGTPSGSGPSRTADSLRSGSDRMEAADDI